MGYVKEKYTKTYFTGRHPDGTSAGYGLEGSYQGFETTLRDFDIQILDKINFQEANVLEIGFGRGESIKYLIKNGVASYVGVDFAEPAFEMALEYLAQNELKGAKIYCDDALEFLRDHGDKITNSIDVVLMLDVVEHIPRHELSVILSLLKNYLSEKAVILLNTPVYQFDNDVLTQGLDERNLIDAIDHADFIPETKGMHCNKYSIASLQEFMKKHHYLAITEAHIFVHDGTNLLFQELKTGLVLPYAKFWKRCFEHNYPLKQEYIPDQLEYAYQRKKILDYINCQQPNLKGIKFWGLKDALDRFQDDGAVSYMEKYIKPGHIVFDVGCYVGLNALFFARLVGDLGRVVCFEPNKYNLLRTNTNLSANPEYINQIDLYDFGLSDADTSSEMLLSDNIESGYASASQLVKGGGIAIPQSELESMGFSKEYVKVKTLDSFVEETGINPNVIKVDIEGAEVSFLKGAMKTLAKHKPLLFIELHNVFASCFVLQTLRQLNYEFHVLSEEWGNRVQIVAIYNDFTPIGLSHKETVNNLFQAYSSYKAKLYQQNLEYYSKQQALHYQMATRQLRELQVEAESKETQLKTENSQLKEALNRLSHAQVDSFQEQLRLSQEHANSLHEQVRFSHEHDNKLHEQVRLSHDQVNSFQEQLRLSQEHANSLQEHANSLQQQVQFSQEHANSLQEHANSLQEHANSLQEHANSLQQQVQFSQEHASKLQEQLQLSQENAYSMQEQLRVAQENAYSMQEQLRVAQENAYSMQEQLRVSQENAYSMQAQLGISQENAHSMQEQLRVSQEHCYNLQEQLYHLQLSKKEYERTLEALQASYQAVLNSKSMRFLGVIRKILVFLRVPPFAHTEAR